MTRRGTIPQDTLTPCKVVSIPGRGRGVVATRYIPQDKLVEVSPVILFRAVDVSDALNRYIFEWDDNHYALALGLGSLFNHSANPNLAVFLRMKGMKIAFMATRDIERGEELCHDYGYEPDGYDGG